MRGFHLHEIRWSRSRRRFEILSGGDKASIVSIYHDYILPPVVDFVMSSHELAG